MGSKIMLFEAVPAGFPGGGFVGAGVGQSVGHPEPTRIWPRVRAGTAVVWRNDTVGAPP